MSRYFTKTLASLEPYTPGEQLKIADIVKLNANENPYPPAPGVAAAVAAAVPGLRLYSDLTNGDLNAAIARHWGVRPENILCGNGSDENLLLALRAFCDENTPLAFADVTYSFYTVLCDLLHIPQHILPLEDDLTIDLTKYCGLHETILDNSAELFHDVSYAGGDRPEYRIVFYLVGIATTAALVAAFSSGRRLTGLGRRTLAIYLLHLPILALLVQLQLFEPLRGAPVALPVLWYTLLAAAALAVLNWQPVQTLFDFAANCWYKRGKS